MKTDLVIAGGGIIGLYTAYKLSGYVKNITIVDKGEIGQSASRAAGGMLTPLLPWQYDEQVIKLTNRAGTYYQALAVKLKDQVGIDIEFWRCGLAAINTEFSQQLKNWCQRNNITIENHFPSNLEELLNDSYLESQLFLPDVSQVRSPRLVKALCTYLQQNGVTLLPHTEVQSFVIENKLLTAIKTDRGVIDCDKAVWATGAWAGEMKSDHCFLHPPNITPVRGQMLAFDGRNVPLTTIAFHNNHYLLPRKDGLILAGSTLEDVGFDDTVTPSARDDLLQKSIALIPALKNCKVLHQWSGLRPGSRDNIPTVGPHQEIKGLFYNCGHFRYGVAMAPRSAEIIRDYILADENTTRQGDNHSAINE